MKPSFAACCLFIPFVYNAIAQQTGTSSNKTTPNLLHPISSITNFGDSIKIDPNVILTNKNLRYFIADLKKTSIKLSTKSNTTPKAVQSFLASLSIDGFTVADAGGNWNCCCIPDDKLPNRQVVCQGNDGHLFLISYLTGGIGVTNRLILVRYEEDKITDFWMGNTAKELKDINSIVKYLSTSKNQHYTMTI